MASVRIASLEKRFDAVAVLRGLDLTVGDREFVTLLGPSGCGKTTTLRCIAGLERPDAGEVYIGEELVASSARRVFVPPNRRGAGVVFQSYALWPHMSVFANVGYPLRVRRLGRREIAARVGEVLAAVGMEAHAGRSVTELSGGQQQRVALARALVVRPKVLLLDEPLSNLDAKLRLAMRNEIRAVHEHSGTTSLYVTHDQAEAIALSDRVVVLKDGAIQQVGTPLDIYRRPANRFVADFVGFENILTATVTSARDGAVAIALEGSEARIWIFPAAEGRTPSVGERVLIAVRAEDVRLVSPGARSAPDDRLPEGAVSSCTYAGERWEYGIELGGQALTARRPEDGEAGLSPGEQVGVEFAARRTVLLPAGGAERPAPNQVSGGHEEELGSAHAPARG